MPFQFASRGFLLVAFATLALAATFHPIWFLPNGAPITLVSLSAIILANIDHNSSKQQSLSQLAHLHPSFPATKFPSGLVSSRRIVPA